MYYSWIPNKRRGSYINFRRNILFGSFLGFLQQVCPLLRSVGFWLLVFLDLHNGATLATKVCTDSALKSSIGSLSLFWNWINSRIIHWSSTLAFHLVDSGWLPVDSRNMTSYDSLKYINFYRKLQFTRNGRSREESELCTIPCSMFIFTRML